MTIHNERLIVVLNQDNSVKSATVFPIEVYSQTEARQLAPYDLADAESELSEMATLFGAATIAERDALLVEKQQLLSDKAALEAQIEALQEQIDALTGQSDNPRHLPPFVFLSLLKPQEIVAMQTSTDPMVIIGRSKLQTIITFVDLDHPDTIQLAQYMESQGLIETGRAARILSGQPPE